MENVSSILSENRELHQNSVTAEESVYTSQSNDCPDCGAKSILHEIGKGTKFYSKHVYPDCDCADLRRKQEADDRARREREDRICKQIPPRFQKCTISDFVPRNKAQMLAHKILTGNHFGSYCIIGAYANGKTHLLYSQFRMCFESSVISIARTTDELFHELRMEDLKGWASQVLECVREKKKFHFFWDDIDKLKVTDWKLESVFALIDGIYRNNQQLTVTSNLDLKELQEKLSPAICRRIDDICTKIEL